MKFREDPPDSVVEEIAAILATGYLRLRKARSWAGPALAPPVQAAAEHLTVLRPTALMAGKKVTPRKKGRRS